MRASAPQPGSTKPNQKWLWGDSRRPHLKRCASAPPRLRGGSQPCEAGAFRTALVDDTAISALMRARRCWIASSSKCCRGGHAWKADRSSASSAAISGRRMRARVLLSVIATSEQVGRPAVGGWFVGQEACTDLGHTSINLQCNAAEMLPHRHSARGASRSSARVGSPGPGDRVSTSGQKNRTEERRSRTRRREALGDVFSAGIWQPVARCCRPVHEAPLAELLDEDQRDIR